MYEKAIMRRELSQISGFGDFPDSNVVSSRSGIKGELGLKRLGK